MTDAVRLMDEYGCQLYRAAEILNFAIRVGSVGVVDYLLSKYKYPLNNGYIKNYTDVKWTSPHQTSLIKACSQTSVKVVTLLLDHDADPNKIVCAERHPGAISVAIHKLHVKVIALFIRGGVNVNTRSYNGDMGMMLPFEVAVWRNNIYATEMLLVSGCSHGVHSLDSNDNHRFKVVEFNLNWCKQLIYIKPRMQELLKEWKVRENTVLPLQQRCRMVILNHLSPQADQKIIELPLPPQLIKYLSIPELDDILETFKCTPSSKYYVK